MGIARSFRELNVYRQADEAAQNIFLLSRKFPTEERFSLTDQIRRSSIELTIFVSILLRQITGRFRVWKKLNRSVNSRQTWKRFSRDASHLSPITSHS